ncbi:MAG TPA: transketolase C-terminal domain-containing protein, partial [Thermodesulfovibrionales bacterium]|nr:transketolase C-terminal domain-containing protein [Thermodesulfovibrionales bacterium]
DKADQYRTPVMILGDGVVGQMMEPFHPTKYRKPKLPAKNWVLNGAKGRKPRVIRSLCMGPGELEQRNLILQKKYELMKRHEVMFDEYETKDARLIVVAFGVGARITLSAVKELRKEGSKVGLFRPITLFPFPEKQIAALAGKGRRFMVVEMNAGQMVEDVRLAVNGKSDVLFYGRPGGVVFTPEELYRKISSAYGRKK